MNKATVTAYEKFDEDVENNFNEDVIPDVLNPFIESDFVAPIKRRITPVQFTALNMTTGKTAPKLRTRPVASKKKLFLTVNTFTTQNTAQLVRV
jgi:hypothetical protein